MTDLVTVVRTGPGSDNWDANRSGSFNTGGDWSKGVVPGEATHVYIQVPGNYVITSNRDNEVHSIDFTAGPASLDITAGTFSIVGDKNSNLSGTIDVEDGTTLSLTGRVNDNGNIALKSTGDATTMQIVGEVIFSEAEGTVTLSGSDAQIVSNGAPAELINGAAINGEGTIGDANLTLVNRGGINANGTGLLTIDTAGPVVSTETIEATSTGGLSILNTLVNQGSLLADKGNVTISGALSGTGHTNITDATLEVGKSVAATQTIRFVSDGTLILDTAQAFHGTVSGLDTTDTIDLSNFAFSNTPVIASVTSTTVNGTPIIDVTITDHTLTAVIALNNFSGIYSSNSGAYSLTSDNDTANGHHPGTLLHLVAFSGT